MEVNFFDRIIPECQACGLPLVFSAREQELFGEKGWPDPKRCIPCRRAKKQRYIRGAPDILAAYI
jgi:Probable zinc-ribbon domain